VDRDLGGVVQGFKLYVASKISTNSVLGYIEQLVGEVGGMKRQVAIASRIDALEANGFAFYREIHQALGVEFGQDERSLRGG